MVVNEGWQKLWVANKYGTKRSNTTSDSGGVLLASFAKFPGFWTD